MAPKSLSSLDDSAFSEKAVNLEMFLCDLCFCFKRKNTQLLRYSLIMRFTAEKSTSCVI